MKLYIGGGKGSWRGFFCSEEPVKARFTPSGTWWLHVMVAMLVAIFGTEAFAQSDSGTATEGKAFVAGQPVPEKPVSTSEAPVPTEEERARREYWIEHTGLPGPPLEEAEGDSSDVDPGTESYIPTGAQAPGEPITYRGSQAD